MPATLAAPHRADFDMYSLRLSCSKPTPVRLTGSPRQPVNDKPCSILKEPFAKGSSKSCKCPQGVPSTQGSMPISSSQVTPSAHEDSSRTSREALRTRTSWASPIAGSPAEHSRRKACAGTSCKHPCEELAQRSPELRTAWDFSRHLVGSCKV